MASFNQIQAGLKIMENFYFFDNQTVALLVYLFFADFKITLLLKIPFVTFAAN